MKHPVDTPLNHIIPPAWMCASSGKRASSSKRATIVVPYTYDQLFQFGSNAVIGGFSAGGQVCKCAMRNTADITALTGLISSHYMAISAFTITVLQVHAHCRASAPSTLLSAPSVYGPGSQLNACTRWHVWYWHACNSIIRMPPCLSVCALPYHLLAVPGECAVPHTAAGLPNHHRHSGQCMYCMYVMPVCDPSSTSQQ